MPTGKASAIGSPLATNQNRIRHESDRRAGRKWQHRVARALYTQFKVAVPIALLSGTAVGGLARCGMGFLTLRLIGVFFAIAAPPFAGVHRPPVSGLRARLAATRDGLPVEDFLL